MALYRQLKVPSRLLFDRVGVFMADIIFTLLSLFLLKTFYYQLMHIMLKKSYILNFIIDAKCNI